MNLPIDDSVRVRVIRALIGITSKEFARRVGVSPLTVTSWERNHFQPSATNRQALNKLCHEYGIAFMPSGYPVPAEECLMFKPYEET